MGSLWPTQRRQADLEIAVTNKDLKDHAKNANAWPFAEARSLLKRVGDKTPEKGYVLFETGYGPSGLPHIGTFGEVARTSMVRHAFSLLSDLPSKLIAFSDDMDGLRKVPNNIPNPDMVAKHLGKPGSHRVVSRTNEEGRPVLSSGLLESPHLLQFAP